MTSDLYFYNQREFHKIPRRYRKLPEDLPESLRFAHLNPKVAALLANKERIHKQEKEDPFGDGLGQKSLIPDINSAFQNVRNQFDSALSNDEDSQRYLFEEAKFSAQGILEQLSRIIYFYDELYKHIPRSLEYQLMSGYTELTADVLVIPREWQTQEMKEQYAASLQRDATTSDLEEFDDDFSRPRSRLDSMGKTPSEFGGSRIKKKSGPRLGVIEASPDEDLEKLGGRKTSVSRQSVISQQKLHVDVNPSRMGSRARKGSSVSSHRSLASGMSPSVYKGRIRDDQFSMIDETPSDPRSAMGITSSYMQTINFQLSNKSFEEKGWIMLKGRKEEVDPNALLEYCVTKLQESMKQSAAIRQKEIEQGYDKSVIVRYYGDTRKETILKFRKSPSRSNKNDVQKGGKPNIPSINDERNEGKNLMQTTHIDGTTIIYYPSGRPAIIYSAAGYGRPGYYTIVYGDGLDTKVLACFTPSGRGVCYHSNGVVRFLSTERGGHVTEENGALERKWKWPQANIKITEPISFQLSAHLLFRCIGRGQMTIVFNCQKETARFSVSPTPGVEDYKIGEDTEQLLTAFTFSSKTANNLMRIFAPTTKKHKKMKRKGLILALFKRRLKDVTKISLDKSDSDISMDSLKDKASDEKQEDEVESKPKEDPVKIEGIESPTHDSEEKHVEKDETDGDESHKGETSSVMEPISDDKEKQKHKSKKEGSRRKTVKKGSLMEAKDAHKLEKDKSKSLMPSTEKDGKEKETTTANEEVTAKLPESVRKSKEATKMETRIETEEKIPITKSSRRLLGSAGAEKAQSQMKTGKKIHSKRSAKKLNKEESGEKKISQKSPHRKSKSKETGISETETESREKVEEPSLSVTLYDSKEADPSETKDGASSFETKPETDKKVKASRSFRKPIKHGKSDEAVIRTKTEDKLATVTTSSENKSGEEKISQISPSRKSKSKETGISEPKTESGEIVEAPSSSVTLCDSKGADPTETKNEASSETKSETDKKVKASRSSQKSIKHGKSDEAVIRSKTEERLATITESRRLSESKSGKHDLGTMGGEKEASVEREQPSFDKKEKKDTEEQHAEESEEKIQSLVNYLIPAALRRQRKGAVQYVKEDDENKAKDEKSGAEIKTGTKNETLTEHAHVDARPVIPKIQIDFCKDEDSTDIAYWEFLKEKEKKDVKAEEDMESSTKRKSALKTYRASKFEAVKKNLVFKDKKEEEVSDLTSKSQTSEIAKLLQDFPDKVTYELEADKDLARLQRKARNLIDDWMEHYRIALGLSNPVLESMSETPRYSIATRQAKSAKQSDTGLMIRKAILGIDDDENLKRARVPSAPLAGRRTRFNDSSIPVIPPHIVKQRTPTPSLPTPIPKLCLSGLSGEKLDDDDLLDIPFHSTAKRDSTVTFEETGHAGGDSGIVPSAASIINRMADTASRRSERSKASSARSFSPSRQSVFTTMSERVPSAVSGSRSHCPLVIRQQILGYERPQCRCSRHHIPFIMDLELDEYVNTEVPEGQLIVIMVVSSLFPGITKAEEMLSEIYQNQNRNRTRPCVQSRSDMFRVFKYDINTAAEMSDHTQPLLLTRHNVVPGMFLMYCDGKLIFCDHIFNGYGSARTDFKKQVMKSRHDAIQGYNLPKDFKFSPSRGKSGLRSAWGGEIGGAGVDKYSSPGTVLDSSLVPIHRPISSSTGNSKEIQLEAVRLAKLEEAASLLATSLSTAGFRRTSLCPLGSQLPVPGTTA